ncbi:MAG: ATP-binding cassette domain-containing protein [Reyranella sp.]
MLPAATAMRRGRKVQAGECTALIGRHGVGKTTTMRSITSLTPQLKGRVEQKGRYVAAGPHWIRRLGIGQMAAARLT